jgi:hypothetical protein
MSASLLIGTPCFGGQLSSLYARSVLNLQGACLGRDGLKFDSVAHWGDSLITRARQGLVTHFLGHPTATHLLFIDSNVGFWPDQVFRLLELDVDIAAAAVPRGVQDRERGKEGEGGQPPRENLFDFEPEDPPGTGREGFVKARAAGTGLMLIKRSVLVAMVEKYRDLRYRSELVSDPADPGYWSYALFNCLAQGPSGGFLNEDESFCRRWTQMGGEIWVDLESGLKGVGPVLHHWKLSGPPSGAPRS